MSRAADRQRRVRRRAARDVSPAGFYTLTTIDGEEVAALTFPALVAEIGEVDPETLDEIRMLAPGETTRQGGGAAPEWSVTREGGGQ